MNRITVFAISVLAYILVSCQKPFEKHWDLRVDSNEYVTSYRDTSLTITVWCSGDWSASLSEGSDWVSLEKDGGSGIGHLTLSFAENPGLLRRAKVKLASGAQTQEVTVSQRASVAAPKLYFENTGIRLPDGSYRMKMSLITNLSDEIIASIEPEVSYEGEDGWISGILVEDGRLPLEESFNQPDCFRRNVVFDVKNTAAGASSSARLTFAIADAALNEYEASLTVEKTGETPYIRFGTEEIDVDRSGGDKEVKIGSNLPVSPESFSVSESPDSDTFIENMKIADGLLKFSVGENESGHERTAELTLSYIDCGDTETRSAPLRIRQTIDMTSFDNCEIRSADELLSWVRGKDYWKDTDVITLVNDIDLQGESWTPVDFNGTFDGNGHSIKGINVEKVGYCSFFRVVSGNAVIRNLTFGAAGDGSRFTCTGAGDGDGYVFVGPIAKFTDNAKLENIVNYADVIISEECTDCTRGYYAGGIAGSHFSASSATGCVNYGKVSMLAAPSVYMDLGGLFGEVVKGGDVSDCENYGAVQVESEKGAASINVGGIIGYLNNASSITGCTNDAPVHIYNNSGATYKLYAGGIIGFAGNANASSAVSPETVSGCRNLAGGTVKCSGSKAGEAFIGGVVGYTLNVNTPFENCCNEAEISADYTPGASCYTYLGGFAGQLKGQGQKITACSSTGNIRMESGNTKGSIRMAGLVGAVASADIVIDRCVCRDAVVESTEKLAASNGVGGLVGMLTNKNLTIKDCICSNVSVKAVKASGTNCAMILAYFGSAGNRLENNGVGGSVDGTVLTAENISDKKLIYNASASAEGTLTYTGTYIIE